MHGWLKLILPWSVSLHVEDKGHGALVALGDLLQPVLFACLQESAGVNNCSPYRYHCDWEIMHPSTNFATIHAQINIMRSQLHLCLKRISMLAFQNLSIRHSEGQFMTPTVYEHVQCPHHSLLSLSHAYLHLQEHLFLILAAPEEAVGILKI